MNIPEQTDISPLPTRLADCRIAVAGLGLMGGSICLALHGKCRSLVGVDPDAEARRLALAMGAVEAAFTEPAEAFSHADLVVLAAPVEAILQLIHDLPHLAPQLAMVIDLGSVKTPIVAAMQELPSRFDPLGGHPMCGKEHSSIRHAEASLFCGATFAFTSLPRTSKRLRELAEELALTLGARADWVEASQHDRWVASTSHLPYLVSHALAASLPVEAGRLVGPGFLSTTRLAGSFTPMMLDVIRHNRQNISEALDELLEWLEELQTQLSTNDIQKIEKLLRASEAHRDKIITADSRTLS